ncbi:MAG: hypothetical protein OXE97_12480 [Gammaproteobacteria bacterium]|nr:hypothetical protein [Gammaproteobacteria bacterium]
MKLSLLPVIALLFITGCATSPKIQVVQAGDNKMSCEQLEEDLKKLDEASAAVQGKKGATGTNVAAALFWLPGLAYTYFDAGQALEAINARRSHLTQLYNDKDC